MGEPLLPTPRPGATSDNTSAPGYFDSTETAVRRPTSASSPGSEGSTSPSTELGTDAPARSSGTTPVEASSSDGGRTFPDGEMSPTSPLLASPMAGSNRKSEKAMRSSSVDGGNGRRSGGGNSSPPGLEQQIEALTSSAEASPASPSAPPDGARPDTTRAGSGPSSPVWLASYDPERSSSRTSEVSYRLVTWTLPQASLFGDLPSERFSETWPTSGMTLGGRAFELPTPAPPTSEPGSSFLPTPDTMVDLQTPRAEANFETGHAVSLGHRMKHLHTPTGSDTSPSYDHRASPGYVRAKPVPNLAAQVDELLLPTPNAADFKGATTPEAAKDWEQRGINLSERLQRLRGDPTNQPSEDGSA